MQIRMLENTKEKLKFVMVGHRYTIPEMLKKQLLTHKEVIMASGMLKHPEDPDCEFVLVVKPNEDAKKILLCAIDELQKEIKSFKTEMQKEVPADSGVAKESTKAKKTIKSKV